MQIDGTVKADQDPEEWSVNLNEISISISFLSLKH